jgi:transcriptional regulator with XRE-family HTH domain
MRLTPETNVIEVVMRRRINLGLTQSQAAAIGGVDPGTWSKAETSGTPSSNVTFRVIMGMLKGVGLHVNITVDDVPETPGDTLFTI